jgi:hypothetical protein
LELSQLVDEIADALVQVDRSKQPFRAFQPGVGPYGEPQLVKSVSEHLNNRALFTVPAVVKRTPDLLIPNEWALEFKITRPFGDNGKEAENWSVNLLHPYAGNVSTIGDCYKLMEWPGPEKRAVVVIGYEHVPSKIDLTSLIDSFEVVAKTVAKINLSGRNECRREGLVHPVHQCLRVFAWQVL